MKKTNRLSQLMGLAAFIICTTPAHAEASNLAAFETSNAEQRINYSGKLRMLSQRIPSAACYFSRGIESEASLDLLVSATEEFETILNALEFGDPALNIQAAETNRKTLLRIHELRAKWEPMRDAADLLIQGAKDQEHLATVFEQNMDVLNAAVELVPQLVRQYSTPGAARYSSLMLVDVSGRQRMLTQKMSKESCLLGTSHASDSTIQELETTMGIFEASLNALRFGLPEVGIVPPPTAQIEVGLEIVDTDWQSVQPFLSSVASGSELVIEDEAELFRGLNATMGNMHIVVGHYANEAASDVSLGTVSNGS